MNVIEIPERVRTRYPFPNHYEHGVKSLVKQYAKILLEIIPEKTVFVNLYFTGTSGAFLAALLLSHKKLMKKFVWKYCMLRWQEDNGHKYVVFPTRGDKKEESCHIIIDDFIESGATLNKMYEKIQALNEKEVEILALCCLLSGNTVERFEEKVKFKPKHFITQKPNF